MEPRPFGTLSDGELRALLSPEGLANLAATARCPIDDLRQWVEEEARWRARFDRVAELLGEDDEEELGGPSSAWVEEEARQAERERRVVAKRKEHEGRRVRKAERLAAHPWEAGFRTDGACLSRFLRSGVPIPPRRREVGMGCVLDGLSVKACAERLGLSPETVRVHLKALRRQARESGFRPRKGDSFAVILFAGQRGTAKGETPAVKRVR